MVKIILKVTYFPPLVDESGVSVSHGCNLLSHCRKVLPVREPLVSVGNQGDKLLKWRQ